MAARILLFRGVTIAPGGEREPLLIERKVRALVLLKPEIAPALEAIVDDCLAQLTGGSDDDGGRHAA